VLEILDDLGVLARRDLDPTALRLAGVPFGARAADALPRHRITGITMAPIVRRSIAGTGTDTVYHGADGRRLHRDEVIDSVLTADGMLHHDGHVSYKIVGGRVVGFALYGEDRGHLAHFGFLATYEQFLAEFGMPDRAEESRVYGDLMGYRNAYWRSRKQACWSASDEDGSGHLSSVNLGDYDGNAGPSSP
jgi:hypothetical protein